MDEPVDDEFSAFDLERLHPEGAPGALQSMLGDAGFELFVARQRAERDAHLAFSARQRALKFFVHYASFVLVLCSPGLVVGAWRLM